METRCKIHKQNTYNIHNLIDKKSYRESLLEIIQGLIELEQAHYNNLPHNIDDNTITYPLDLPIGEAIKVNYMISPKELFSNFSLGSHRNSYLVSVVIERDIGLFIHPSDSKRIVIRVTINNNNDSIEYKSVISYANENKRLLKLCVDNSYSLLVGMYKDYGI